jgi:hypothetical protein
MTPEGLFFTAAVMASSVSVFGIVDALATLRALNESDRSWDINARLLARAGVRTASLRTVQMLGLVHSSVVSLTIEPRPAIDDALAPLWLILSGVCGLSAVKEILAMWDRRHIMPDVQPPEGWTP